MATTCISSEKRRKHANQSTRKKIGVMIYINKLLRLLLALLGLLIILLSIILDNSFNDHLVRFIAFAIFALATIFFGFLTFGWFSWIPLQFIAFVKQRGFLQQVVPCSPWYDNVVTNFCGEICTLESLEQEEGIRLFELPRSFQNFLYGDQISTQRTIATTTIHSTFDSKIQDFEVATLVEGGQDLQGLTTKSEIFDFSPISRILECSHSKMEIDSISSPNLQKVPSQGEGIIVEIVPSRIFHILGNE